LVGGPSPILIRWARNSRKTRIRSGRSSPCPRYSPYNPVVIQRLLNIYRVFYNYAKRGDDKKTTAMRIGLAVGPVDIGRIINFREERRNG
jgi:hypothetical protein